LLHALLGIGTHAELMGHPKIGASWEGFALNEVVTHLGARPEECFFWALHTGGELDLLIVRGLQRRGFGFQHTDSPRRTRAMHSALKNLHLDRIDIVHPGPRTFVVNDRIRAVALAQLFEDVEPLAGL